MVSEKLPPPRAWRSRSSWASGAARQPVVPAPGQGADQVAFDQTAGGEDLARLLDRRLGVEGAPVAPPAQADTQLRFLSQFLPTAKQYPPEKAVLDALEADGALGISVVHNEYKALGLKSSDGLRLVRSGTFDVITIQIGTASRDDAFLEGIDLIGVSTDMSSLRDAVDAYRNVFDDRVQEKFNVKVLAL